MNKNSVLYLKFFLIPFGLLWFGCILPLEADYRPSFYDKCHWGKIDWGFYYTSENKWMLKLKEAYSHTCGAPEWAVRRSIVPATMVDPKGTLFTITLYGFGGNGPNFRLTECWYSNTEKKVKTKTANCYPWKHAYNHGANLNISDTPYLDGLPGWYYSDRNWFRWSFHNCFHPCISQEINNSCSTCVRVLYYIPNRRLLGGSGFVDNEGMLFLKFTKTKLDPSEYAVDQYNPTASEEEDIGEDVSEDSGEKSEESFGEDTDEDSDEEVTQTIADETDESTSDYGMNDRGDGSGNCLGWNMLLSRWAYEKNYIVNGETKPFPPVGFSNSIGNFHAFQDSNNLYLYHMCRDGNQNLIEYGGVIHCNYYNRTTFARKGGMDIAKSLRQTSCGIIPRFVRAGNYVYFATFHDGYYMNFYRVKVNADTAGTPELLKSSYYLDIYVETHAWGHSEAPYAFDFCVLDKDGAPSTASSSDDKDKIICVFSVGGGNGAYEVGNLTEAYGWNKTYLNWGVRRVTGCLASGNIASSTSLKAWGQNVIYVTDYERYDGNFVSITSNGEDGLGVKNIVPDVRRLYLNSHKIVPYTSPSGKHYIIYAYCYPGKTGYIYLGYAQYFLDSSGSVRLRGKTEFKAAKDNSAWGESFGYFNNCNRIVSMDLKNGNLWITFLRDNDYNYYYFHVLAKDLIEE